MFLRKRKLLFGRYHFNGGTANVISGPPAGYIDTVSREGGIILAYRDRLRCVDIRWARCILPEGASWSGNNTAV